MINYFKEMIDNLYDRSSDYQVACAQFCFMKFIKKELNFVKIDMGEKGKREYF